MFTIDYIAKDMGFTIPFVRKCLKQMDAIFKNCYKKGEFNRIYFNQNGYVIFDQIKQLKATGLKLEAIKTHLENQLKHSQTPSLTDTKTPAVPVPAKRVFPLTANETILVLGKPLLAADQELPLLVDRNTPK